MHHTLGLTGCPRSVEDEHRILRVHRLRVRISRRLSYKVMIPIVTTLPHPGINLRAKLTPALNYNHMLNCRRGIQRLICVLL